MINRITVSYLLACTLGLVLNCGLHAQNSVGKTGTIKQVQQVLEKDVLQRADNDLTKKPITVTAAVSDRSAGGKHDFYSEGDYWWPNPASPDSPYIRKDGLTNPDNFVAHRQAMIRFSRIVGNLASAWRITHKPVYLHKAMEHCIAWFVDTATRMNPDLLYAQAIKGRVTGRGIGIIDAIQLMEVAQGLYIMQNAPEMDQVALRKIKKWFADYLTWVSTHPYGLEEMHAANNHGTCWVMQVACFARFTGNMELMNFCRDRYKKVLLPEQMAKDGSFPKEMARTKPYGYALFNLDAMTTICQVLSTAEDDLYNYQTPDGKSIKKGIEFMFPYMKDKTKWPLPPDVMYWDQWPVAQPALLFGAARFGNNNWFNLWSRLDHFPEVEEVIRNLPVRNPLIWL